MTRRTLAAAALAAFLPVSPLTAQTPAAVDATPPDIRWRAGSEMPHGRDHHSTFLVRSSGGDFLYVAGGTNYREMFDGVLRARIAADGTLGAWESAGALPSARGGTSIAVVGDHAVLTGGQIATGEGLRGLQRIAEVFVARVQPDGSLGDWRAAPPMPAARFHHPALAHDGSVYVVGGQGEKEAEAAVFAAGVNADGTLEPWREVGALPRPRSHHAAFIEGGHIYVVGGMDGAVGGHQALFNDVIRAPIRDDGTLGAWQTVSRVPHSLATHAAFAHDGYLWALGGVEDALRFVPGVWRAQLRAEGRVGAWEEATPLPLARGHVHNTPVLNGRIYSAGGRVLPATRESSMVSSATHIGEIRR